VTGYGNFHVNVDRFLIRLFHFLSKNPDVPIILCGSYHRKSIKTYVIVLSTSVRKIKKCDVTLNLLPEVSFSGLIFHSHCHSEARHDEIPYARKYVGYITCNHTIFHMPFKIFEH